jgi:hypothetical protein
MAADASTTPVQPTETKEPNEKELLELENMRRQGRKLDAEILSLNRPFWSQPSTWFSGTVALVAAGGFWIQHSLLNYDFKRAQLESIQAKNEQHDSQLALTKTAEELFQARADIDAVVKSLANIVVPTGVASPGHPAIVEGTVTDTNGKAIADTLHRILRLAFGHGIPVGLTGHLGGR